MGGYEIIQRTIDDHRDLMAFLGENNQISHLATIEQTLPKVVLLAAASDLEARTQQLLIKFFEERTSSHEFAVSFVKSKAVDRQFHTYFNWKERSANQFFGLFGKRFKQKITKNTRQIQR